MLPETVQGTLSTPVAFGNPFIGQLFGYQSIFDGSSIFQLNRYISDFINAI
jgi:hypothetical protein